MALVLFGLAIAFVVTEIGTRLYVRARAHDYISVRGYGVSDVPGIAYLPLANQRSFSNNLGLINDTDTAPQKPPGTFRILVLGDSVAQVVMDRDGRPDGDGRKFHDDLFSKQLEVLLRSRTGRDVEVLNLSATGLSLAQELTLFRARGAALDPDLVLFAYCYNDPIATEIGPRGFSDTPTFPAVAWLIERLTTLDDRRREGTWYDPNKAPYRGLEVTFAEVGALASERKVAVVGLPLLWNDRAKQIHLAALEELTSRNHVPYVNLWERLRGNDLESLASRQQPRDRAHYTLPAHQLVAKALADAVTPVIAENLWPPRP